MKNTHQAFEYTAQNDQSRRTSKVILLAEDDKFISRAYFDGLTREGYKVITAFDGNEALKSARENRPDLIMLDLIMPLMNGFELLEELKKDEELKSIPVIILSNLGQESDIKRGKELGAVDYMVKSNFSMKEVANQIRKYFD